MKTKNTRLVYTDEKNLKAYQSLPAEDFKEFFMTYLTYQEGDDVSKTISNPFVQTLFMAAYADKIEYNEKKWEEQAKANRENGKKGGRPRKNVDITPNEEFDTPTTNNDTTPNTIMATNFPNDLVEDSQITEQKFDNHTETLKDFLDDNIDKIRQSTDIIAKSIAIPNSAMEATAMFYQEKIRQMKEELGTITQDAIDFEKFINEEIDRKIREIRYERATA